MAALNAAIVSARRQVLFSLLSSFMFALAVVVVAGAGPGLGGVFGIFALVAVFFALLGPATLYARIEPWIGFLEELRRGIEEGRIRLEDVCGRPLGPGGLH